MQLLELFLLDPLLLLLILLHFLGKDIVSENKFQENDLLLIERREDQPGKILEIGPHFDDFSDESLHLGVMRDTDSIVGAFEIFEVDLKDSDSQLEEIAEKIVLIGLSEILKRYHPLDFELNQRREIPRTLKDVVCDPFRLQTREVNVVDQRYFQLRDLEHPFL